MRASKLTKAAAVVSLTAILLLPHDAQSSNYPNPEPICFERDGTMIKCFTVLHGDREFVPGGSASLGGCR